MSKIDFLSHEEVCELTGARTKERQIANLKRNGIRHTIKVNGWPSVTANALTSMGATQEQARWQPRKAG